MATRDTAVLNGPVAFCHTDTAPAAWREYPRVGDSTLLVVADRYRDQVAPE